MNKTNPITKRSYEHQYVLRNLEISTDTGFYKDCIKFTDLKGIVTNLPLFGKTIKQALKDSFHGDRIFTPI